MATFLPPAARKERTAEKRRAVLRLLRDEIYTTREVVQELLGVAPTPAKMTLSAMVRDGLLRMEQVQCPNGWKPFLWGITAHGQALAFDEGEQPMDRVFEPGRVGLTVVKHTITIQLARLRAERQGWKNWQSGDRLAKWEKDQGRPDAIATSPTGEVVAVEVELTMKTTKRYESVLFDRLRQIKAEHFAKVVWLSPDLDTSRRLESIIKNIREFDREHAGVKQHVIIDPDRHHPCLKFMAIENWPNI